MMKIDGDGEDGEWAFFFAGGGGAGGEKTLSRMSKT